MGEPNTRGKCRAGSPTPTNEPHEIIRRADRIPMFTGKIEGVGPRYRPSVEDKINRFRRTGQPPDFLEPEGLQPRTIFPTAHLDQLPFDIEMRTSVAR